MSSEQIRRLCQRLISALGREHFQKVRGEPPRKTAHPILQIKSHTQSLDLLSEEQSLSGWVRTFCLFSSSVLNLSGLFDEIPRERGYQKLPPQLRGLLRKLLCVPGGSKMNERWAVEGREVRVTLVSSETSSVVVLVKMSHIVASLSESQEGS